MVKFHLRHGLRGLRSVELELSSYEFKPTEEGEEDVGGLNSTSFNHNGNNRVLTQSNLQ